MASTVRKSKGIADISEPIKGKSLWRDSFERLVRNRMAMLGILIILINILVAIFADQIARFPYDYQQLGLNNAAPQWVIDLFPNMKSKEDGGYVTVYEDYILGADSLGRDIFSRLVYGARISLSVAFIGPVVSLLIGLSMGLLAGYLGGRVDNFIMRVVDVFYALPTLLVIILLMAYFRSSFTDATYEGTFGYQLSRVDQAFGGLFFIFIGIGLTSWVGMARLTRGQVLSVREREYILAARSLGAKDIPIMWRHVMPNILGPIIVAETLTIPAYISTEAFLSFIGLGVNPPTPSWGAMISEGSRAVSSYPNQAIFPALALFFIMFAFNFLGDGLRDALDPRMRGVD